MKKFIKYSAVLVSVIALASCSMFQLDNYDGPDAQIHGRLIDKATNELVGVESSFAQTIDWANVDWSTWYFPTITTSAGTLLINELGWKDKEGKEVYEDQRWAIRFDGQYRNNLIFAGDYKAFFKELPCYELENPTFNVKKGDNTHDFEVVPFCRINTGSGIPITYNAATNQLVAKFKVELGDNTKANSILNIKFCGNTQLFVGADYFNLVQSDDGAKKQGMDLSAYGMGIWPAAQPGEEITLTINCDKSGPNAELFKYTQDRYFRIAAQAGGNGYNGNSYYNFSKIYKVSADFKTIEEAVWDNI